MNEARNLDGGGNRTSAYTRPTREPKPSVGRHLRRKEGMNRPQTFSPRFVSNLLLVAGVTIAVAGCGEVPSEEDPEVSAPIAEPGIRPTPRPDAGTGGEMTSTGTVAVKVSPGRVPSVGSRVGLEGNVTTTFHSTKAVNVGLDISTSATSAKQMR